MWCHLVKFLPLDNAASKLKPNCLLTVILTYAALSDVTQTSFTVFVSCKHDFKIFNYPLFTIAKRSRLYKN